MAKLDTNDPVYGEMIDAREVAKLTGITIHQIRSWRRPEFKHLAKFKTYRSPLNNSVWYRLADVEKFLTENGVVIGMSGLISEDDYPNAIEAPLLNPEIDQTKRKQLATLAGITTKNFWERWYQELSETYQKEWTDYVMANQRRFYAQHIGIDDPSVLTHLNRKSRSENLEQYFYGGVMCARTFWAMKQGWNITEEEIIAIPVGELPPTVETK